MGAMLYGGILTASRYAIECPRCHRTGALTDCDALGRTLVICECRPRPFLMPLINPKTERIPEWRVDLSPAALSRREPRPRPAPAIEHRRRAGRQVKGKPCRNQKCWRVAGPKANYCPRCTKDLNSKLYPCGEGGCTNLRRLRSPRCKTCQRALVDRNLREFAARRVDTTAAERQQRRRDRYKREKAKAKESACA